MKRNWSETKEKNNDEAEIQQNKKKKVQKVLDKDTWSIVVEYGDVIDQIKWSSLFSSSTINEDENGLSMLEETVYLSNLIVNYVSKLRFESQRENIICMNNNIAWLYSEKKDVIHLGFETQTMSERPFLFLDKITNIQTAKIFVNLGKYIGIFMSSKPQENMKYFDILLKEDNFELCVYILNNFSNLQNQTHYWLYLYKQLKLDIDKKNFLESKIKSVYPNLVIPYRVFEPLLEDKDLKVEEIEKRFKELEFSSSSPKIVFDDSSEKLLKKRALYYMIKNKTFISDFNYESLFSDELLFGPHHEFNFCWKLFVFVPQTRKYLNSTIKSKISEQSFEILQDNNLDEIPFNWSDYFETIKWIHQELPLKPFIYQHLLNILRMGDFQPVFNFLKSHISKTNRLFLKLLLISESKENIQQWDQFASASGTELKYLQTDINHQFVYRELLSLNNNNHRFEEVIKVLLKYDLFPYKFIKISDMISILNETKNEELFKTIYKTYMHQQNEKKEKFSWHMLLCDKIVTKLTVSTFKFISNFFVETKLTDLFLSEYIPLLIESRNYDLTEYILKTNFSLNSLEKILNYKNISFGDIRFYRLLKKMNVKIEMTGMSEYWLMMDALKNPNFSKKDLIEVKKLLNDNKVY